MLLNILAGILASKVDQAKTNSTASAAPTLLKTPCSLAPNDKRRLTISRDAQMLNCACKYRVVVDGREIARLRNDEVVSCDITESASVQIYCGKAGVSLRIRAGEHPYIRFNTNYGGSVNVRLEDAEILSQNNVRA